MPQMSAPCPGPHLLSTRKHSLLRTTPQIKVSCRVFKVSIGCERQRNNVSNSSPLFPQGLLLGLQWPYLGSRCNKSWALSPSSSSPPLCLEGGRPCGQPLKSFSGISHLVDQPLDKALNYLWLHFHCEDIKRERRKSVKAKRRKATVEVPFDRAAAILLLGQWMDILLQPRREAFMEAIMAFDVDDR